MPPVLDLDEGISPIEVVTGEEILQLLLNISKAGKVFTAAYNDMAEEIAGSGDFECLYVLHRHPRQNPKYANTVAFLREVGEGAVFYIIDKNGNWREPVADIIPDERGGREGLGTLSIPYEREDGSIGTEESTTYWVPDEDPLNRLLPQGTILKYLIISGKALEKIRDELIGYIEGMRQEGKTDEEIMSSIFNIDPFVCRNLMRLGEMLEATIKDTEAYLRDKGVMERGEGEVDSMASASETAQEGEE